jgi:hypothetical protein
MQRDRRALTGDHEFNAAAPKQIGWYIRHRHRHGC